MMLERVALAKVTEHDSIQSAASKAEVIATSADFLPCDSSGVFGMFGVSAMLTCLTKKK